MKSTVPSGHPAVTPRSRHRRGSRQARRLPAPLATALVILLVAVIPPSAPDDGGDHRGHGPRGVEGWDGADTDGDVPSEQPATDRSAGAPVGGTGGRPVRPDVAGSPGTRFGVSVPTPVRASWTSAFAAADSRYGGLEIYRTFYPGPPAPWPGRAGHGRRPVVVSFRFPPRDVLSGRHDDLLARWFRSAPTGRTIYWVYNHEPEDDIERGAFTAVDYRAAWRHLRAVQRDTGRADLKATLALMCWTVNGSRRDWRDYYPGDDVIDVMAWDCYNTGAEAQPPRYTDPAAIFDPAMRVSAALGKPFGIAETGSARIAGDPTGTGRAAWLRAVGAYLVQRRAVFVCYYDAQKNSAAVDYRLTDTPSRQAWKALTSAG